MLCVCVCVCVFILIVSLKMVLNSNKSVFLTINLIRVCCVHPSRIISWFVSTEEAITTKINVKQLNDRMSKSVSE